MIHGNHFHFSGAEACYRPKLDGGDSGEPPIDINVASLEDADHCALYMLDTEHTTLVARGGMIIGIGFQLSTAREV
jgi:hypothetical protein